ncbi:MAG: hypothetical protein WD970_01035 [Patescibacteria group bacterium]
MTEGGFSKVPVKSNKTLLIGVIFIQLVVVFSLIMTATGEGFHGYNAASVIYRIILVLLGIFGIWIIIRNNHGYNNLPLWLGKLFGLLPLIISAIAGALLWAMVFLFRYS